MCTKQTIQISLLLVVGSASYYADAFTSGGTTTTTITDTTCVGSLTVPQIGVGTIAWSENGKGNKELNELISTTYQRGGAFFDTGERYGSHAKTAFGLGWGETETLTAKLLRENGNKNINNNEAHPNIPYFLDEGQATNNHVNHVVATKFTPSPSRTTVESVVEACEASRKRLGVDSIDLYQIQMPDIVKPMKIFGFDKTYDEVYWDGLAECYERGLVKNVGVSNYGPTLVTQCYEHLAKRGVPLASNQIAYSLIGRHSGAQETLDTCNDLGVKVLAYYPFAMGLLTGKYTSSSLAVAHEDALTNSLSTSKRSAFERKDLEQYAKGDGKTGGIARLLRTMELIAKDHGPTTTIAQVALNYIICKGAIPIPGARTAEQYVDNMGALGWRLTESEVAEMEEEADALGISFEGAGFKRSNAKFVGYGFERWGLA